MVGFEIIERHVTPELAYIVEIERAKGKFGGREDIAPLALRATMIFRPEDGVWKVVARGPRNHRSACRVDTELNLRPGYFREHLPSRHSVNRAPRAGERAGEPWSQSYPHVYRQSEAGTMQPRGCP